MSDVSRQPRLADYATLALTYFAVGVTVSVAMVDAGVSIPTTLGAALVVYSATSELAFLAVKAANGSTLVGVLSGWLVASRFGLLAMSLGTRYQGGLVERTAAAINSFDPNVGLAIQQDDDRALRRVFWKVTAALMIGWWLGAILGAFVGDLIGDGKTWGLDAVFPAVLVAIVGALVRRRDGLTAALTGALICCLLISIAPGGLPILASSLGAVFALATTSAPGAKAKPEPAEQVEP